MCVKYFLILFPRGLLILCAIWAYPSNFLCYVIRLFINNNHLVTYKKTVATPMELQTQIHISKNLPASGLYCAIFININFY